MKHLGDITKINGAEIEPVWCITGGSPCQDLSVAGKRKGLAGERSGLFMEQVRIVKGMREHDKRNGRTGELVRPRFLVWENVPGVASSNFRDGFGDFGAVLEEIVRIAEPTFSLPRLQGKQKWTKAGAIDGDGWSVAWRTHDAQYWGVPQRRRRIALVADFGGKRAGEILFECESLSWHPQSSGAQGEEIAHNTADGVGEHDRVAEPCLLESNQNHATVQTDGICTALPASMGMGGGYVPMVTDTIAYGINCSGGADAQIDENLYGCLTASANSSGNNKAAVAYTIDGRNAEVNREISGTLQSKPDGGFSYNCINPVAYTLKVRGGVERDSAGRKAGKSALIQTELSATLGVSQDQTLFQPTIVYGIGNGQVNEACDMQKELAQTINTMHDQQAVCYGICSYDSNAMKSSNPDSGIYEADTTRTLDLNGGNPACNQGGVAICEPVTYNGANITSPQNVTAPQPGDPCHTIGQDSRNIVCEPVNYSEKRLFEWHEDDTSVSIRAKSGSYGGGSEVLRCEPVWNGKCDGASGEGVGFAVTGDHDNRPTDMTNIVVSRILRWIVRRLTPLECTRLQGFPDGFVEIGEWVDSKGKKHKDADSPKYKALGNSIALPYWAWMLNRMAKYLPEGATMGSLFCGIGGFDLCWERIHGAGTSRWCSEIEEFPIAVMKRRFGDDDVGEEGDWWKYSCK